MMVVLYIGSRNVVELNAINFIMCLQSHDPSEIIKICYSRNISYHYQCRKVFLLNIFVGFPPHPHTHKSLININPFPTRISFFFFFRFFRKLLASTSVFDHFHKHFVSPIPQYKNILFYEYLNIYQYIKRKKKASTLSLVSAPFFVCFDWEILYSFKS